MRFITMACLAMCLIIPGMAAEKGSKTADENPCPSESHAHQYSDIRMALLAVVEISPCGFRFVNLEDNTVGLNNSFQFAENFQVLRLQPRDDENRAVVKIESSKKLVKKGMRGLVTYCAACKTVFTFRPSANEKSCDVTMNP